MARGINKVILIGNLGRDPELSYSPNGMAIARFSLATTEGRKKEDGTWEDVTEWHRVVVFGKNAENVGQYCSKGQQVYVEGRLHYDSWEKDGVKRYSTDIVASTVRLLGRRDDAGAGASSRPAPEPSYGPETGGSAPAQPVEGGGDIEDDLPF
jgi:single-strand DNA-binding protein